MSDSHELLGDKTPLGDKTLGDTAPPSSHAAGDRLKFYPDEPLAVKHKYSWSSKEPSKFYDPCQQCRQASIDCVLRNQDDRTVCQEYFDAYKECKKDFFDKRRAEKRAGQGGWGWT